MYGAVMAISVLSGVSAHSRAIADAVLVHPTASRHRLTLRRIRLNGRQSGRQGHAGDDELCI